MTEKAKNAYLSIRIDADIKKQAEALFKELGLDISSATGIFFRQAIRCNGLPFDVKLDEPLNFSEVEDDEDDK